MTVSSYKLVTFRSLSNQIKRTREGVVEGKGLYGTDGVRILARDIADARVQAVRRANEIDWEKAGKEFLREGSVPGRFPAAIGVVFRTGLTVLRRNLAERKNQPSGKDVERF